MRSVERRHLRLSPCKLADLDHQFSGRTYAHVYHRPGTICVAKAFWSLPAGHRLGVFWHEVGHLLHRSPAHSERAADDQVNLAFGINVQYRDGQWGRRLQWVDPPTNGYDRALWRRFRQLLPGLTKPKALRRLL